MMLFIKTALNCLTDKASRHFLDESKKPRPMAVLVLQIIASVITAILTALGATSCMGL